MPITIAWYQKVASYIAPITLRKIHSQYSSNLLLQLYKGQLVLTTSSAMYSYGNKYAPFTKAFAHLHNTNQLQPKRFLLLGGAMLSALQILDTTYNLHPAATVVEIDGKFQQLVNDYLPSSIVNNLRYHHTDAQSFVANCTDTFDMLGIDIFIEMQVPAFCMEESFLQNCKKLLAKNGIVIMNTHFTDLTEKKEFATVFSKVFSDVHIITYQNNYIFVGIVR